MTSFRLFGGFLLLLGFVLYTHGAAPDNKGTDFVIGFANNYQVSGTTVAFLSAELETKVQITGSQVATQTFTIPALQTIALSLSLAVRVPVGSNNIITNLGIRIRTIESTREFSVIGLNQDTATTDAFLGIPVDVLGTSYRVMAHKAVGGRPSQLLIVGTDSATSVTITTSVAANGFSAGVPRTITGINALNTFLVQAFNGQDDLTGSLVTSTKPIAVFGGTQCGNVPDQNTFYCDHMVEMLPPTETYGTEFFVVPLATRTGGDTTRVLAHEASTTVQVNGAQVATLGAGQYYEFSSSSTTATRIITSKGTLVAQYSKGSTADGVTSDPFEMIIPPVGQFGANYFFSTPSAFPIAFSNWVNLVIQDVHKTGLALDGAAISPVWKPIAGTTYVWAQVQVAIGAHRIFHNSPLVPFGLFSYGWASYDSYGYPGALRLAPIQEACTPTTMSPGDGIDNDCDNRIDEELLNGIDDDADGRVDEDCTQVRCNPLCDNGVCIRENVCQCDTGWGGVDCSIKKLVGYCSAWGDPHYTTFESYIYHFQGVGVYVFAKHTDGLFEVQQRTFACGGSVSCTDGVGVIVGGKEIAITFTAQTIDEVQIGSFPASFQATFGVQNFQVTIAQSGSGGSRVWTITFLDVEVVFRQYFVSVRLLEGHGDKLVGLCANFLGGIDNTWRIPDPTTSDGLAPLIPVTYNTIIKSHGPAWRVNNGGVWRNKPGEVQNPPNQPPPMTTCTIQSIAPVKAYCENIRSQYTACSNTINPQDFVDTCITDICATGDYAAGNPSIQAFIQYCKKSGEATGGTGTVPDVLPPPCTQNCEPDTIDGGSPGNYKGWLYCQAYGDPHYKLFDDRITHFQGSGAFLFASGDGFEIQQRNFPCASRVTCTDGAAFITQDWTVVFKMGQSQPIVNGVPRTIPAAGYNLSGAVAGIIRLSAGRYTLTTASGLELVFYSYFLSIKVPPTDQDNLDGFCVNPTTNWFLNTGGAFGNDVVIPPANPPPIATCDAQTSVQARSFCKGLQTNYLTCSATIDPKPYEDTCVFDICATGNFQAGKDSMQAFIELCKEDPKSDDGTAGVDPFVPDPPCTGTCTFTSTPVGVLVTTTKPITSQQFVSLVSLVLGITSGRIIVRSIGTSGGGNLIDAYITDGIGENFNLGFEATLELMLLNREADPRLVAGLGAGAIIRMTPAGKAGFVPANDIGTIYIDNGFTYEVGQTAGTRITASVGNLVFSATGKVVFDIGSTYDKINVNGYAILDGIAHLRVTNQLDLIRSGPIDVDLIQGTSKTGGQFTSITVELVGNAAPCGTTPMKIVPNYNNNRFRLRLTCGIRATCSAWGDPHYTTFDNEVYHFQGLGVYMFAKDQSGTFEIHQRTYRCGGAVTCTDGVAFSTQGASVRFESGQARVNGNLVTLPHSVAGTDIFLSSSGGSLFARFLNVEITFYGTTLTVTVPEGFQNRLAGLCGSWPNAGQNGYLYPNGQGGLQLLTPKTTSGILTVFAPAWALANGGGIFTQFPQPDGDDGVMKTCTAQGLQAAQAYCSVLLTNYPQCADVINPQPYYDTCVDDSCASGNLNQGQGSINAYVTRCNIGGEATNATKVPNPTPPVCTTCDLPTQDGGSPGNYKDWKFCSASGDPHYLIFGSNSYIHFQGLGAFRMAGDFNDTFEVQQRTYQCGNRVTCTDGAGLFHKVFGWKVALTDAGAAVNGQLVATYPHNVQGGVIKRSGSTFTLTLETGVEVVYYRYFFSVKLPPFIIPTTGFCVNGDTSGGGAGGNAGDNPNAITDGTSVFGNDVPTGPGNTGPPTACSDELRAIATAYCNGLRDPKYATCTAVIDPQPQIDLCIFDICATGDVRQGESILADFLQRCSESPDSTPGTADVPDDTPPLPCVGEACNVGTTEPYTGTLTCAHQVSVQVLTQAIVDLIGVTADELYIQQSGNGFSVGFLDSATLGKTGIQLAARFAFEVRKGQIGTGAIVFSTVGTLGVCSVRYAASGDGFLDPQESTVFTGPQTVRVGAPAGTAASSNLNDFIVDQDANIVFDINGASQHDSITISGFGALDGFADLKFGTSFNLGSTPLDFILVHRSATTAGSFDNIRPDPNRNPCTNPEFPFLQSEILTTAQTIGIRLKCGPLCNPACVHGQCVGVNICACDPFYKGPTCNILCTNAVTCSGNGQCTTDATCNCAVGYTGENCELRVPGTGDDNYDPDDLDEVIDLCNAANFPVGQTFLPPLTLKRLITTNTILRAVTVGFTTTTTTTTSTPMECSIYSGTVGTSGSTLLGTQTTSVDTTGHITPSSALETTFVFSSPIPLTQGSTYSFAVQPASSKRQIDLENCNGGIAISTDDTYTDGDLVVGGEEQTGDAGFIIYTDEETVGDTPGTVEISTFDPDVMDTEITLCSDAQTTVGQTFVPLGGKKRLVTTTTLVRTVTVGFTQTSVSSQPADVTCSLYTTGTNTLLATQSTTVDSLGYTSTATPLQTTFVFAQPIQVQPSTTYALQVSTSSKKRDEEECANIVAISEDVYPDGTLLVDGEEEGGDLAFEIGTDTVVEQDIPGDVNAGNFEPENFDTETDTCEQQPLGQTFVPLSQDGKKRLITTVTVLRAVTLGFTQTSLEGTASVTCTVYSGTVGTQSSTMLASQTQTVPALGYSAPTAPLAVDFIFTQPVPVQTGATYSVGVTSTSVGKRQGDGAGCLNIVGTSFDSYDDGTAIIGGEESAGDIGFETFIDTQLEGTVPGTVDESSFFNPDDFDLEVEVCEGETVSQTFVPLSGRKRLTTTTTLLRAVSLGFTQTSTTSQPAATVECTIYSGSVSSGDASLLSTTTQSVDTTGYTQVTSPLVTSFVLASPVTIQSGATYSISTQVVSTKKQLNSEACVNVVGVEDGGYDDGSAVIGGEETNSDLGFQLFIDETPVEILPGEVDQFNFDTELIDQSFPLCDTPDIGQTFVINGRKRLGTTAVLLRSVTVGFIQNTETTNPTDTVQCSIYSGSISSGSLLTTDTAQVNSLGYTSLNSPLQTSFVFSNPPVVTAGSTYSFAISSVAKKKQLVVPSSCVNLVGMQGDTYSEGTLVLGGVETTGDLAFIASTDETVEQLVPGEVSESTFDEALDTVVDSCQFESVGQTFTPLSARKRFIGSATLLRAVSLGFTETSTSASASVTCSIYSGTVGTTSAQLITSTTTSVDALGYTDVQTPLIVPFIFSSPVPVTSGATYSLGVTTTPSKRQLGDDGCLNLAGISNDVYPLGSTVIDGEGQAGDLGFDIFTETVDVQEIPGDVDISTFDATFDTEVNACDQPLGQTFVPLGRKRTTTTTTLLRAVNLAFTESSTSGSSSVTCSVYQGSFTSSGSTLVGSTTQTVTSLGYTDVQTPLTTAFIFSSPPAIQTGELYSLSVSSTPTTNQKRQDFVDDGCLNVIAISDDVYSDGEAIVPGKKRTAGDLAFETYLEERTVEIPDGFVDVENFDVAPNAEFSPCDGSVKQTFVPHTVNNNGIILEGVAFGFTQAGRHTQALVTVSVHRGGVQLAESRLVVDANGYTDPATPRIAIFIFEGGVKLLANQQHTFQVQTGPVVKRLTPPIDSCLNVVGYAENVYPEGQAIFNGVATNGDLAFQTYMTYERINCITPFGEVAQLFDVFVDGNFACKQSEVQGRVAVGGSFDTFNFGVGCKLFNHLIGVQSGCTPFGGVTCAAIGNAHEWADTVVVGGAIQSTNTEVRAGNVVHGSGLNGQITVVNDCNIRQGSVVNFGSNLNYLKELSLVLRDEAVTGTIQYFGTNIVFNAGGAAIEVWNIDGLKLSHATSVEVRNVAFNSTVIINVKGNGYSYGNFGFVGVNARRAVWNFHEATTLNLYQVQWPGVVLAPLANVQNPTGNLQGQVFAHSWVSTQSTCMAVEFFPFNGCLPIYRDASATPETSQENPNACTANYECQNTDSLSKCVAGSCECIPGAAGTFGACTCNSPATVQWVNEQPYCVGYPGCTADWQCHAGEKCVTGGQAVGTCQFSCQADWQCSNLGGHRVCDTGTSSCKCIYGTDAGCNCNAPSSIQWYNGVKFCLAPGKCFYDWQCNGALCVRVGNDVGDCS